MTRPKDQQIQRAVPGYIVLEEAEYYPQHNTTNSVLRLALAGVVLLGVGYFLFSLGTALIGILIPDPVIVVDDLTQASVIEGEDGNLHVFLPIPTVLDVDVQPELSYFEVEVPSNGSLDPETMTTIVSRAEDALAQTAYARGLVAEVNNSGPQLIGYDLFPGTRNLIFHTQFPEGQK